MNLPNPNSKPDPQNDGGPPVISFGKTTIFDKPIDTNIATALCYVPFMPINFAAAVLVFMSPSDNNRYARFHAVQSGLLGVALLVVVGVLNTIGGALSMIPLIGLLSGIFWLASLLISLGYFAFSAKLAYDCYRGQNTRLPYLAAFAEEFSK